MKISVQFEAQLREIAGTQQMQMELPDDACVFDAVRGAAENCSQLEERLLTTDNAMQPGIMIFVNDQPVLIHAAASHSLRDKDSILLLPAISGG